MTTNTLTAKNTLAYAQNRDKEDTLSSLREQYIFPQHEGRDSIYFCGNSLGLSPKTAASAIQRELDQWHRLGVEGHFDAKNAWIKYHDYVGPGNARLVGAKPAEVIVMNTLTVNLHLLMASFYRPTSDRYKIIMEGGAFPSDQYALASQAAWHKLDPADAIVEVEPRAGEHLLHTEDIIATIERVGTETALVLFGGLNYYTGQFFDLAAIAKAAKKVGAVVGFDLAHAVGNVPLQLHDWGVDFAVWCTYKYVNSGPGAPSGAFIHERNYGPETPRLTGWWGYKESRRFLMEKEFVPEHGAAGWQMSNAPIFSFAAHRAALKIFDQTDMAALRAKSIELTAYLEYLLSSLNEESEEPYFEIITPHNSEERGCQLSVLTRKNGKKLFDYLAANGVICDWREPNVIRLAPVPMYNSFEDVWRCYDLIRKWI